MADVPVQLLVVAIGIVSAVIGALAKYSVAQLTKRIDNLELRLNQHHENHDAHIDSRTNRQLERIEQRLGAIESAVAGFGRG